MFERNQKIFVQFLLLAAGLMFQCGALLDRVVLLGVAGRNFLTVDAALEDFNRGRVVGRQFGERHELLRQMRDERGLNQRRLDQFFKHRAGDFKIFGQIIENDLILVKTLPIIAIYYFHLQNLKANRDSTL